MNTMLTPRPPVSLSPRDQYMQYVHATNTRMKAIYTPVSPRTHRLPPLATITAAPPPNRSRAMQIDSLNLHPERVARLQALKAQADGLGITPRWAGGEMAWFGKVDSARETRKQLLRQSSMLAESQAAVRASTHMGVAAAVAKEEAAQAKVDASNLVRAASDALNSRFSDMFKAFQKIDINGDGKVDEKELKHALRMWNIELDDATMKSLISACDVGDGDGKVDYKEFVDVLARDTVTSAAMGKRDMQAKEAMGVDSLDKQYLGHRIAPKHAIILGEGGISI